MKKSLCIAFDLDDTLYKERDFVMSGRAAVARHFSSNARMSSEKLMSLMCSADNAFDALLAIPEIKNNGTQISDVLDVYRNHFPHICLSQESRDVLAEVKTMDAYIGIITDGRKTTQWNKIKALGLDAIIDGRNIIVSEDIGADKITSRPFEIMMERCPAMRYVYIGDNPSKDFRQARRLGWITVMLLDKDGYNVHSQDMNNLGDDYRPDFTIENIKDLTKNIIPCLLH